MVTSGAGGAGGVVVVALSKKQVARERTEPPPERHVIGSINHHHQAQITINNSNEYHNEQPHINRVGVLRMCKGTGAFGSVLMALTAAVYALYTAVDLGAFSVVMGIHGDNSQEK
jgi:hypothetical protein